MFIAIPLANKPTWRSPPWMTVLLIVVNMLIYWGWQAPEERRVEINAAHYERSGLAPIEIPLYLDHLQCQAHTPEQKHQIDLMRQAWKQGHVAPLYEHMWAQQAFRQALLAGEVIRKDDPRHADWQGRRALFTPLEPQPFSWRWAMNFGRPAAIPEVEVKTGAAEEDGVGRELKSRACRFQKHSGPTGHAKSGAGRLIQAL